MKYRPHKTQLGAMVSRLFVLVFLVLFPKDSGSTTVLSTAPTLRTCPAQCACAMQESPQLLEINCTKQNLTAIPTTDQVMEFLIQLDVSDNRIIQLPNNTFEHYPNLKKIDASLNEITAVDLRAFHGVHYIQEVDLSRNLIMFIHPDTFSENPYLEMVDLSGNPLTKLSDNVPILNAPMITSLVISFCKLTLLTPAMFKGVSNLTSLDIRNNDIKSFPLETFKHLENLVNIEMDFNRWPCSDCKLVNDLNSITKRRSGSVPYRVTCVDNNAGLNKLWSVSSEFKFCEHDLPITLMTDDVTYGSTKDGDVSTDEFIPERKAEVFGGVWFYLQQHSYTSHILLIASIIMTTTFVCTAVCMTCVLKRRHTDRCPSSNDQPDLNNKNLVLAFARPTHKRNSLVPLLDPSSPDGCPSSPLEWNATVSQSDQPLSLYEEFLRTRPISDHLYPIIE